MATNERFDEAVSKWLEETAPAGIPERVLLATFERTRRSRQSVGWRALQGRPQMLRFATALGVAAVIVAAAALALNLYANQQGIGGPPSPSPTAVPSPTESPAAGFSRFISSQNGISIDYPTGWQIRPATEGWTNGVISFDAPGVEIIFDPSRGEDLYLAVASEPLNARPDHVWREDLTLPECPGGHAGGVLTFDGASGWVVQCGGSPVRHSALLTTETRGYAIVLYLGEEGLIDTYTGAWFVSILETLDLREDGAGNGRVTSK